MKGKSSLVHQHISLWIAPMNIQRPMSRWTEVFISICIVGSENFGSNSLYSRSPSWDYRVDTGLMSEVLDLHNALLCSLVSQES